MLCSICVCASAKGHTSCLLSSVSFAQQSVTGSNSEFDRCEDLILVSNSPHIYLLEKQRSEWNQLLREIVESPLRSSKATWIQPALDNLLWVSLLEQMDLEVPSNLNPVILRFCKQHCCPCDKATRVLK